MSSCILPEFLLAPGFLLSPIQYVTIDPSFQTDDVFPHIFSSYCINFNGPSNAAQELGSIKISSVLQSARIYSYNHLSSTVNYPLNSGSITFPTKPEGRPTARPSACVIPVKPTSCTQIAL